jgi:hypothetical protein
MLANFINFVSRKLFLVPSLVDFYRMIVLDECQGPEPSNDVFLVLVSGSM